jgi:hypothetical protein
MPETYLFKTSFYLPSSSLILPYSLFGLCIFQSNETTNIRDNNPYDLYNKTRKVNAKLSLCLTKHHAMKTNPLFN